MLEDSTRQSLSKTLEDLQKELDKQNTQLGGLEAELEAIQRERDRIASLILHIKEMLGLETGGLKTEIKVTTATSVVNLSIIIEKPIKEGISEIFDEFKRRMDVNELAAEFRRRGWKLSENNPQEVIRNALKRNPKLFRKAGRGIWEKIRKIAQA